MFHVEHYRSSSCVAQQNVREACFADEFWALALQFRPELWGIGNLLRQFDHFGAAPGDGCAVTAVRSVFTCAEAAHELSRWAISENIPASAARSALAVCKSVRVLSSKAVNDWPSSESSLRSDLDCSRSSLRKARSAPPCC